MKSKGERERYTQLKAELQKTARRDKKTFLNKQCKEAEENNKMGKTRDLFKKIGDFRGTFHARMGMIKDRNENLREPKEIKKRWKKYTEKLYKKCLHDPDNYDGMVTHQEPDILDYKAKWASGSITMNKANGDEGILAELFQILKDEAVKVLHSNVSKFGKLISGHRTRKGQFSFESQRRAIPKNVQTTI